LSAAGLVAVTEDVLTRGGGELFRNWITVGGGRCRLSAMGMSRGNGRRYCGAFSADAAVLLLALSGFMFTTATIFSPAGFITLVVVIVAPVVPPLVDGTTATVAAVLVPLLFTTVLVP